MAEDRATALEHTGHREMLDWYFRGPRSAREVAAGVRRRHQRRARLAAAALARAKKQARKAHPKYRSRVSMNRPVVMNVNLIQ